MCDARQGDGVIVAVVQCDDGINGSSRLMEGGSPACSPLSGASCNQAGRNLSGWAAELFFMFWMSPCSFLPVRVGMIWMSPARVMSLKHTAHPPEFIIVVQLEASVFCSPCREAAAVKMLDMTSQVELINSCCSRTLCLYLLIVWKDISITYHSGTQDSHSSAKTL